MDKAVGSGGLLGFAAFLTLTGAPQIDDVTHRETQW
jgi:hypothetical protein